MLSKAPALALFLAFMLSMVTVTFAYGGDGFVEVNDATVPNFSSVCWDDVDNDGDGQTDELDTGCINPPQSDLSELDRRDYDSSWVLAGGAQPGLSDTSLFLGGYLNNSQRQTFGVDSTASGYITEYYLTDSTSEWAGGVPNSVSYELGSSQSAVSDNGTPLGSAKLVTAQNMWQSGLGTCGNGIPQPGEGETNHNCPSDMGLPDDAGTTETTSNEDIRAHAVLQDISDYDTYNLNEDSGDEVVEGFDYSQWDENLEAKEYQGGKNVDLTGNPYELSDLEAGISSADESSDTTVGSPGTYDVHIPDEDSWSDNPDFYLKEEPSPEIWAVYVYKKGTLNDFSPTIDAHYLKDEDNTKREVTGTNTFTGETCSPKDSNSSCQDDGTTKTGCKTSTVSEQTRYYFDSSDEQTASPSADTQVLQTSYDSPSYSDDTTSSSKSIDVTYWGEPSTEKHDICTDGTIDQVNKDCKTEDTPTSGCTISDDETIYTEHQKWSEPNDEYWGKGSKTVTFSYEDLELAEIQVFDTNKGEQIDGFDENTIPTLFSSENLDDYSVPGDIIHKSVDGKGYYSVPSTTGDPEANSNSVSRSRFQVRIDNGKFKTVRTSFSTFDVDGSGYGVSLVSINDRSGGSVIGYPEDFAEREIVNGNSTQTDFASPSQLSVSGSCPGEFYYCIGSVQIGLQNMDSWSGIDPSTGVVFSDGISNMHHVNESYSACRLFQDLVKEAGNDRTPLRCQYDNARNFPGNPTPAFKKPEKPFIPEIRYGVQ